MYNYLSQEHHQQLLGRDRVEWSSLHTRKVETSLKEFGLSLEDPTPVVQLPLPKLGTVSDLLPLSTAKEQHHIDRLYNMLQWSELPLPVGKLPRRAGWYYYQGEWKQCKPPSNRVMVLDIEAVQLTDTWYPVCACVRVEQGWLLWLNDHNEPSEFIQFGEGNTIYGWNIPYDRQYLQSEYRYKPTGNRFSDGMSHWVVTRGVSNQQRPAMRSEYAPVWSMETTGNSLNAVHQFYFGTELDKSTRADIMKMSWTDIPNCIDDIVSYCFRDVVATLRVFGKLYPEYLRHRPSIVSQVASLILGSVWLPLSKSRYPGFYDRVEAQYLETMETIRKGLIEASRHLHDAVFDRYPFPEYTRDNYHQLYQDWLRTLPEELKCLDWSPARSGKRKGVAQWLRDIKLDKVTLHQRWVPIVLGMTWKGIPVTWNGTGWVNIEGENIPHPDNPDQPLTDLFIKGIEAAFESGILATDNPLARELLSLSISTLNWVSTRKRVKAIRTCDTLTGYPVVLPQINPNGTITGRAADSLWQVLANPRPKRIGTELKSMVEAPEGYAIVGADVDSQELWLAATLGDTLTGYCGSTPISNMCLVGDKSRKTDPHNVVAKQLEVGRNAVKNLVYGVIYGLGLQGAKNGLNKSLPGTSPDIIEAKARQFHAVFKGNRSNISYQYYGGLASESFNVMERIADDRTPRTPVLGGLMTNSLAGVKDFKPTRVNWTIQASGVDYRDLSLVLMNYLISHYNLDARLIMTIHDEFRYLVNDTDANVFAYLLQVVHVYVRAYIIDTLGLDGIPSSIAWHSGIDIDKVLRKEPNSTDPGDNSPCVTPTQPHGLPLGRKLTPQDQLEQYKEGLLDRLFP